MPTVIRSQNRPPSPFTVPGVLGCLLVLGFLPISCIAVRELVHEPEPAPQAPLAPAARLAPSPSVRPDNGLEHDQTGSVIRPGPVPAVTPHVWSEPAIRGCPQGGAHSPGKIDHTGRLHCAKCGEFM